MPITRTAWQDDDGTGTTGTIINNAEKQIIYNQIDAALLDVYKSADLTIVQNTQSGALTDWVIPGRTHNTIVEWSGGAAGGLYGIAGGVVGDRLTIRNVSPQILNCVHASTSSSVSNRLYHTVTSGFTPVAFAGWISYYYNGSGWVICGHEQGSWITAAYNPANFYAGWTVDPADLLNCHYRLDGRTVTINVYIATSSIGSTQQAIFLAAAVWGGYTPTLGTQIPCLLYGSPNPNWESGTAGAEPGNMRIGITRFGGLAFPATANTLYVCFDMTFQVT